MTPDVHSAIPYSMTLTSLPAISDELLPLPPFTATRPAPLKAELFTVTRTSF
jgi:hypothetical protein